VREILFADAFERVLELRIFRVILQRHPDRQISVSRGCPSN
jgi:hypothetical protein